MTETILPKPGEQPIDPYDFTARVRSMRFDRYYAGAILAAAIVSPSKAPDDLAETAFQITCSMLALRSGGPQ